MITKSINCPYVIYSFPQHNDIKNELLSLINYAESTHPVSENVEVDISRADWFNSNDFSRPWVNFISEHIVDSIKKMYMEIGFDGLTINEIWFQQYFKNSKHGWHTHSANFTNVYYLELSEESPKTLLLDPFDKKTIIEVDVKEGDILLFPSFILHKAPENMSDHRKTIISYNVNATCSENLYDRSL